MTPISYVLYDLFVPETEACRSHRKGFTNPLFLMEETEDAALLTPATFQFDFSTYELVAQGAEGVGPLHSP